MDTLTHPHPKRLHAAPASPQKILHIACATGSLTHHLATHYPTAQVIGISPKSVDATLHGRRSNLIYIKSSLEELIEREDMLFWPGTFDYIVQHRGEGDGGMVFIGKGGEYMKTLKGLVGEGGWVEVQEVAWGVWAGSGREGVEEGDCLSERWEWMREIERGCEEKGVDVKCGGKLAGWMREAGMVGVEEIVYKVPIIGSLGDDESGNERIHLTKVYQDLLEKFSSKNNSAEALSELKAAAAAQCGKCVQGDFTRLHIVIGQNPRS